MESGKFIENPIVIEDREELIFMLCEASELEHMLMLQYLYATFTLKQDVSEGVTEEQLAATQRWERVVTGVAVQEMMHLALASNLLTSLGAAPHFRRPNFPQRANYYPPGVQLALLPFGETALRHFIFLERPEGMEEHDAAEFEVLGRAASAPLGTEIVPFLQDFATVGHLYRGIELGFAHLVEKYGEERVFVGPADSQATQEYFGWPELGPITDLESATAAIETVVEQGEGARGDWQDAHYGRFLRVYQEYLDLKEQDPSFEPARPAVASWVRLPGDPTVSDMTLITDPLTASVVDLFNASYEALIQTLVRFFVHLEETPEELMTLADVAVTAMFAVIKPLGRVITTLPVGPDLPGRTAGPNFEYYRTGYLLPHKQAAWTVLQERLLELASACSVIASRSDTPPQLASIEQNLRHLAAKLDRHL